MSNLTQEKIARSNPKTLLFNSSYIQKSVAIYMIIIAIILVLIGAAWLFFPYKSDKDIQLLGQNWGMDLINMILYFLIFLFAFYALYKVISLLLRTEVEKASASLMEHNARLKTLEYQGREIHIGELEKLVSIVRNTYFNSSIFRLFSLIVDEARDKKFVSSTILMEPYRNESDHEFSKISVYQKIVLQLGILGTFIGLINAFSGLNLSDYNESLVIISLSLKYAFSTSIAGLISSIVLGLLVGFVRRSQEAYFKDMEKATVTLTSLGRKSISEGVLINSLNQATEALKQNKDQLRKVEERITVQTDTLDNGIAKLKKTEHNFFESMDQLTESENAFVEKMGKIYETLSPNEMSQAFKQKLEEATTDYFKDTKKKYVELNRIVESTTKNMNTLQQTMNKQNTHINHLNKNQEKFIATLTDKHITGQVTQAMRDSSLAISKELSNKTEQMSKHIDSFGYQLSKFNTSTDIYLKRRHRVEKIILWIAIAAATYSILRFNGILP